MQELTRAARSIRVFADYLERHPEALIRGKTGGAASERARIEAHVAARLWALRCRRCSPAAPQTQPTNFYTLSSATEPDVAKRSAEGLVIGLGPITLPQYLDRPDIVTREGANQMRLAEFSKWAEPLEPLLTRIMAEDLYALLDASDVIPIPQRGDIPLDRVSRSTSAGSTPTTAGEVVLDARWRIYQGDNETLLDQRPLAGHRAGRAACPTTTPSSPR